MRYATEYLHLIAPGSQPVETRHFKELQDQLGSVIDLANAVKYLRELNNDLDGILNSKLAELIDDIQNQFLATLEDIEIDTGRFPIYHETEGRDLTDVKGIGDKTKELLLSAGIRSLDDLAQLENIQLEQQQGLSDQLVARAIREDWIAQARKLAL